MEDKKLEILLTAIIQRLDAIIEVNTGITEGIEELTKVLLEEEELDTEENYDEEYDEERKKKSEKEDNIIKTRLKKREEI